MFGHHPLLERELRKNGRRALAEVMEVQRTHVAETRGDPALIGNTQILWKFVMRVEPEGESSFEAKVNEMLPQTWSPTAGSWFPVLYDPRDHSKVVVDHSDEGNRILDEEMSKERVDIRVARMRASGQDVIADRYAAIHDPALGLFRDDNLSSDPDERQKQLEERRAKIKEMMGGQPIPTGGQPAQPLDAAGVAARADALVKLADLRDRGALTDEEFQAQKKKLLGE